MKNTIRNLISSFRSTRSKWLTIVIPIIVLGILFFSLTVNNVFTPTYDIDRFGIAKETIRSPITIENKQETERKTRDTVQSVNDRYETSKEITNEQIGYVNELFDAVKKLDKKKDGKDSQADDELTTREKVQKLSNVLSPEITEHVDELILTQLLKTSPDERRKGQKVMVDALKNVFHEGVRTENVQTAKAEVKQQIKYSSLDNQLQQALMSLSNFAVTENAVFDVENTMAARKDAASSVEPVMIRAGEIIVREGQTITNEKYQQLKLVGLLNKERNVYPIIGLALLLLLITGTIGYEMYVLDKRKQLNKGKAAAIILISIFVVALMKGVSLFTTQINQLYYLVPVATGVLLLKQLIHERFAIVLAGLYAILGSIIFNGEIPGSLNMEAGIYFFFSQLAAIGLLANTKEKDRLAIVKTGIGLVIVNIITVLLFLFLSFEKYNWIDFFIQSGFGIGSAFLSVVLTIGLLPFFETGLGILTDMKLLSLSSPNQPLIKKILTEAPGTYHHSIMVANLSEAVCEAIGANGLLARVGAYYHDIGKTVRPHYFIENQLAVTNPHDQLDPKESAKIIISHPYDGVAMLREQRLPEEIIDIAKQHHGTTLLKFFYYKEKKKNDQAEEADFRYPGPKPQSKEAGVVNICDSVEAAVRSLKEPTEDKIEEIVSSIIKDRLLDGQLDECPLTMEDLHIVNETICETLKGIFHSRIQYPTTKAEAPG
ncbi:HD family phosphohydrolase [Lentibacillus daqui]|uniref:HD family phosphohydrolase n=1 Tax=Lentibacillus daqui TaxID=2911514 RepID=UPI0022B19AE4|nr:HDIG domain-containing metalloprotein [Lentibacillus daqui]